MNPKIDSQQRQVRPGSFLDRSAAVVAAALAAAAVQAASPRVVLTPAPGYAVTWDGNNGGFFSPAATAGPSDNIALASRGTTAFGSSEYGIVHFITNVNNGLYGNNFSWLPSLSEPSPFVGLSFASTVEVRSVAWSRDNGNTAEPGCAAGSCTDRALGLYTVQVTAVDNPDGTTPQTDDPATGWATIGVVEYRYSNPPQFTSYLRHRFEAAGADGQPIPATGLLIRLSDGMTAIDEIEANTLAAPELSVTRSGNEVTIAWVGSGAFEYATSVNGPWTCLPGAVSGHRETIGSDAMRLYRLRR